jgi:hypothetical protein
VGGILLCSHTTIMAVSVHQAVLSKTVFVQLSYGKNERTPSNYTVIFTTAEAYSF